MKEIRPDYYKSNGVETIDVIEAFDLNFNLGNVIKYILRAGKKQGEEKEKDLNKACFYLNREIIKDQVINEEI
ncbi:DUF3310 domain-containing protein [Anaerococcus hydrogenalis]|jgi:hypothetical protein|uniref:DUF3310 domain-containing protein n=1 Tax=Anaerococcus hydrogenalis TaxID=33029 RepID=UPI002904C515|nr:DUF3310 domain-containing protein [Anaerococcus hydrogenalis]MDU1315711.1 DUF3310 domain-containing protein [Anaerococcus hydrogenalis]